MSRIGFHLLHLFWMLVSPSYRRDQASKVTTLVGGQRLVNVHPATLCHGHPCAIHNPSGHHMTAWPQVWRSDRSMMERTCPHGIGHPDPDHMTYILTLPGPVDERESGVHGCDGCCHKTPTRP